DSTFSGRELQYSSRIILTSLNDGSFAAVDEKKITRKLLFRSHLPFLEPWTLSNLRKSGNPPSQNPLEVIIPASYPDARIMP
ncbi:hypothetical protein, partial [Acinetobacter baumannii]|uniref:hypothetical protein n=1 Tax=Acinetobacter baumannii TaxID=470 RepID=UPI001C075EA3